MFVGVGGGGGGGGGVESVGLFWHSNDRSCLRGETKGGGGGGGGHLFVHYTNWSTFQVQGEGSGG